MKAVDVLKQYLSTIESPDSIMSSFYEVEHCSYRERSCWVFLEEKANFPIGLHTTLVELTHLYILMEIPGFVSLN